MNHTIRKVEGGVTLPGEAGAEKIVLELADRWGADAIRDSDGTKLSDDLLLADFVVYSTICLVRADQEYPKKHPEHLPQKFLMSEPTLATSNVVEIDPMENYFCEKYRIDTLHNPKEWWQVFDRTTGGEVPRGNWSFDEKTGKVIVKDVIPFHIYTVNFLVWQIWDSTSMYNYLTNNWTGPHIVSIDPYHKEAREHLMKFFDKWLESHKHTDVVRLTTLAYHFTLDSDRNGKDKFRDWTGYTDTVSIPALLDFEKQYGYRLTSEDFVDEGYYNATHRVPSQRWRDWMEFIHNFVVKFGKELVQKIHRAGKMAAIFQGDHWIGVEPYSPKFAEMKIDINIGACEDGVALRRISDSPWNEVKEIRLYPYFFPDVFREGGNPTDESMSNWVKIRRAMIRRPVDRIGYGGYLSLTSKFPDFVEHVGWLCDDFRRIKKRSLGKPSWCAPVKVGILNAWGKLRSWINNFTRDQKFLVKRPDVIMVAGSNLLECLSGLPVEVEFISFDDITQSGIPSDISVIINDGEAETAWSGGRYWSKPEVVSAVREFVYNGGGFIGVQEPSAYHCQGRFFQLFDVLGVDKEVGATITTAPVESRKPATHFILDDDLSSLNFGVEKSYVYPISRRLEVLRSDRSGMHILLSSHQYGRGRAVYIASLPFSFANSRLLLRAIFWSAGKEGDIHRWFSSNPNTDCAYWPDSGSLVVVNNVDVEQTTVIYDGNGVKFGETVIGPYESKWFSV